MEENYKKNRLIFLLKDYFPPDQILINSPNKAIYGTDASKIFKLPLAVIFPKKKEDVQFVFEIANKFKASIIPRGRGTNVVGDCVPVDNGIVVSTLFMNKILDIDDKDFVAEVEPGVLTGDLQTEVEKKGLFYPPDPSSASFSTVGGNIATNAGGLRAVKYGVTKDYVLGVDVVLPTGELISTGGRFHKNSVGLNLTGLFVGSEGTLGFITKAILKLLPLPEESASLLIGFKDFTLGLDFVDLLLKSGILPVALEFLDDKVGKFFTEQKGLTLFILKIDGNKESVKTDIDKIKRIATNSAFIIEGRGSGEQKKIWDVRRILNQVSFNFGTDKLSLDVTVPRGKIRDLIYFVREKERNFKVPSLMFGHVGDGNLHVNLMYYKDDVSQSISAKKFMEEVYFFVIKLGGSISGEHGVGLIRLPFIKHQLSKKELDLMKHIKAIFDPYNIMNRGKGY